MLLVYLLAFVRFLVRLVRVPKPGELALINPNAKCPCCGHESGKIRAVEALGPKNERGVFCLHTCNICGARLLEEPIVKSRALMAAPPIPSDFMDGTLKSLMIPTVAKTEAAGTKQ